MKTHATHYQVRYKRPDAKWSYRSPWGLIIRVDSNFPHLAFIAARNGGLDIEIRYLFLAGTATTERGGARILSKLKALLTRS